MPTRFRLTRRRAWVASTRTSRGRSWPARLSPTPQVRGSRITFRKSATISPSTCCSPTSSTRLAVARHGSRKDGKGGGAAADSRKVVGTDVPLRFLDGLKLSFGIENVTNARPAFITNSPDASNTDASIYDPYQRQYYFVVTKKF